MKNILTNLGIALLTTLCGIPTSANINGNLEGWVQNELPDVDITIKSFVWKQEARDTNSKGWVFNTNRAPLVVKPGQSVMFDWIWGSEANGIAALFGKTFLKGARVEFAGDKYKPVDIWFEACFRGKGPLVNLRRIDACATKAGSFIGQNCITGHPDQPFLQDPNNWWMAQGLEKNQVEFIQSDGLLVFARGVIYPITQSPDAVFVFRKQEQPAKS